jgi:hypothetical protein
MTIDKTNLKALRITLENTYCFAVSPRDIGRLELSFSDEPTAERDESGNPYSKGKAQTILLSLRRGFHVIEDANDDEITLEYLHKSRDIVWLSLKFPYHERGNVSGEARWDGAHSEWNEWQRSKLNRHGDLFIAIGEDAALLDRAFPDEVINTDGYEVRPVEWDVYE